MKRANIVYCSDKLEGPRLATFDYTELPSELVCVVFESQLCLLQDPWSVPIQKLMIERMIRLNCN